MKTASHGVPLGASALIPRLFCRDPATEVEFCVETFGATEMVRRMGPEGDLVHALLSIGEAMLMIEAEWPTHPTRAPSRDGSSPVVLYLYVDDVDQTVERATAGRAQVLSPAQDQFWGDRTAWVMDSEGHVWTLATRVEATTEQERSDRWARLRDTGN